MTARVLVADDNAVDRAVTVRHLQRFGLAADVVVNGAEAVDAVVRNEYELVFMDVHMPLMDGFEATQLIRASEGDGRHTTIVALTANALAGDRERCLAAGMDDYLSKPLVEAELERVAGRWLRADPIDVARVESLRNLGDSGFLRDLVAVYADDAAVRLATMRAALVSHNAAELAAAAHALKSSAANMGAAAVRDLAARIEQSARAGSVDEHLVAQLEVEQRRAIDRLRDHVS